MLNNFFFKLKEKHMFHLVDASQFPFMISITIANFLFAAVVYLHKASDKLMFFYFQMAACLFLFTLFTWFMSVLWEAKMGYHTRAVRNGLRFGMALFIVSEILFFFAFFWSFFHFSLAPSPSVGSMWPPKSIQPLDIWGLPLVNTLLLLSSGVTITLAHHAILMANNKLNDGQFTQHLLVTILLGLTFLLCQVMEYKYGVSFTWKENVYGTVFFVTTGFHGLHVTIGTIFLLLCLLREIPLAQYLVIPVDLTPLLTLMTIMAHFIIKFVLSTIGKMIDRVTNYTNSMFDRFVYFLQVTHHLRPWRSLDHMYMGLMGYNMPSSTPMDYSFNKDQHFGFEAAAWYWHFVDVVWMFLFVTIYWWGS